MGMKTCWVVRFKDGTVELYSEQEYKKNWFKRQGNVITEEHWFDVTKAKDTYRNKL